MSALRIALPEIGQNVKNYVAAIKGAGMEPVVISVQTDQLEKSFQQEYLDYSEVNTDAYDGLLLPGGGDIDPARYGQENTASMMISPDLDALQFDILDRFVKADKPVFGICRGMQIINVYFGGTLIQDLPTCFYHYFDGYRQDKVHDCVAVPTSWLGELYGDYFFHNSSHHQAVDRLGEGLVADQRSLKDGVIEGIHHESLPVYAVQWHPERMCLANAREDTVDGLAVLEFFEELCRKEARKRRRTAAEELAQTQAEMSGIMGL